jgi:sulfatase modifying factor 1
MLRRLIVALGAAAMSVSACGFLFDVDSLGGGSADSGAPPTEASRDAPSEDGAREAEAPVDNGCPIGKGPAMVRVGDHCIDSTEVTRAHYDVFLGSVGPDAGGPDTPQCSTNASFVPADGVPPVTKTAEMPVVGVDWCDATAYCAWAGKTLCGSLDGEPLSKDDAVDPSISVWAKACTKDGTARFAYGDEFERGRCNVDTQDLVPAGSPRCEGGYAGVHDMIGNAGEWLAGCEPPLDRDAPCFIAGGNFREEESTSCRRVVSVTGRVPWPSVGIRCCSPAKK